ncbi:helix-turn-helix domain-containing protein [Streptomyces sp. NPDC056149]|uniref:helix-turn-helix domain-containing protein n=1 Tax=unclassified Streptomyces TaxID=2593676 RepID=UPI002380F0D7|nr:helix-turn-helix domain-containing protein [Streptomyces sp. WZ-12]
MSEHGRRGRHRTVDRVAWILEAAARAPGGVTVAELARTIGAPASSVQDLVNGLVATGFLLEQHRRFRLGPAPHVLNLIAGRVVPRLSQAELDELSRVAGTPVLLTVRVGLDAVYLARGGEDHIPRLVPLADEHLARPLLRTAAGRLLLAFTDEAERRGLLDELARHDPEAVAEFRSALPSIRASRISRSEGLADPEVSALAIPVTDGPVVTGALALMHRRRGRSERLRLDRAAARLLAHLQETRT